MFKIIPPTLVLILSCTQIFSSAAFAEGTPDGITPANEGICDEMADNNPFMTRGLYGLCVAYCEARDFSSDISDVDTWVKDQTAGAKILANFNKKKTETDPDMPCIVNAVCPAWTEEELASVGTRGYSNIQDDHENVSPSLIQHSDAERVVSQVDFPSSAYGDNVAWVNHFPNNVTDPDDDTYAAGYRDYVSWFDGGWNTIQYTPSRYVTGLTFEEYSACKDQIFSHTVAP